MSSLSTRTRRAPGLIVIGLIVAVVLLVIAFATVTGTNLGAGLQAAYQSMFPPDAVTVEGAQIRDLYNIVFFIAAAIFIAVEGLIVWTVIRYRRKPGDDELPAQTHGNNLAETLWTVIPTAIVAYLFFISWQTLNAVEAVAEEPGVQVVARAAQFQWSFDYLADDGTTVEYTQFLPTGQNGGLFVPVGEPVKVTLVSPDVIHAFYVPQFLFKRDVVPGRENIIDFTIPAEEAGQVFRGQCAELCGAGHAAMVFDVHAMTRADYDAWLERAKATAQPTQGPGETPPVAAETVQIAAQALEFSADTLEAPADQPFAIHFDNQAAGIPHDVAITGPEGLIFNGDDITGPADITYQVPALAAGSYEFLCTIHPQMTGTLTVQ